MRLRLNFVGMGSRFDVVRRVFFYVWNRSEAIDSTKVQRTKDKHWVQNDTHNAFADGINSGLDVSTECSSRISHCS